MTRERALTRSAAGMGAASAVSRLFGAVRVFFIAAVLGTTYLGNTFQASNTFSTVLFELLAAGALSAVLVPTFVDLLDHDRQPEAERTAGGVLGLALAVLGAIAVIGVLAAPWIARLLTSAVDDPQIAHEQQKLATFLLRFFIPQVLLYALGAISTAVLNARRVFALPAAAPIGNTVVLVGALVAFAVLAGPNPGLDLTLLEQLTLALGGTLGVAAFVAIPTVALWTSGFRLRPRWAPRDPAVRRLLRLSVWAGLQHTSWGLLLGAAIIVGGGVEGGVVAYQVAFVSFLAPYGILAQPIHTAILPELSEEATRGDLRAFGASLRWALDSMAMIVVPVSVAMIALSVPVMRVLAFGNATKANGVELMAAGLASLAIGLFAFGAFLLLARAYYALGDSRVPALVGLATAFLGVAIMIGSVPFTHGAARIFALGLGHSVAFIVGTLVLSVGLSRRTGVAVVAPALPRVVLLATVLGAAAWWVMELPNLSSRVTTAMALAGIVTIATAVYVWVVRRLVGRPARLAPSPEGAA